LESEKTLKGLGTPPQDSPSTTSASGPYSVGYCKKERQNIYRKWEITKQNKTRSYNNENMMASDVYQWGKKLDDKINFFAMNVLKYGKKMKNRTR